METLKKFNVQEKTIVKIFEKKNHPFPELRNFLIHPNKFLKNSYTKDLLKKIQGFKNLNRIPELNKDLYKQYEKDGNRDSYEGPYNKRRENLSVLVFLHIIGKKNNLEVIEKYLTSICKEHTWVMPFHKGRSIDLWSSDTAFILSEILFILKKEINPKIYNYIYNTINERVFIPYLDENIKHEWYKNNDNRNAVCNSEIGCSFLLIESNDLRKAKAIKKALKSLRVYIEKSFKNDGSTEEGIHYRNYGIGMFTIFSEMLRASTKNGIDLLKINKIKKIVEYPSKIQLNTNMFATFSDSSENTYFHPGIIQRLSERTKEDSLLNLISKNSRLDRFGINLILRYILWWNGKTNEKLNIDNAILKDAGIVRLTKGKIRIIAKTGNNGENHNHNDVGSFIIHHSGDNFITDPGAGLYSKGYHDYESLERYKNIFANSYGHSIPKIDGKLQMPGMKYFGKIIGIDTKNYKFVKMDMANAYEIPKLRNILRRISIDDDNNLTLTDKFILLRNSPEIEEAFITWLDVAINGNKAILYGKTKKLVLTIEQPKNIKFRLEKLEKESKENKKSKKLKRLSFIIPESKYKKINVKMKMEFN